MKNRFNLSIVVVLMLSLLAVSGAEAQSPLGTGFTYQGYLALDGSPVTGTCDFQFELWDDPDSGEPVSSTVTKTAVVVTNGIFTIKLDFGAAYDGEERWLETFVRCPAGSGSYTLLSPRQELTAAPYALYSLDADKLDGQYASAFWNISGNAGTTPGTNYIGTNDNQALEIRVNGLRVMRMEPSIDSPNIIGGYSGNWITSGVIGATICGGGLYTYHNSVTDEFGVVGGGLENQAGDNAGTTIDKGYATVSGGLNNTSSGYSSTVGGGSINSAIGFFSTVGGGDNNIANGFVATIAGGESNTASGFYSMVAGGAYNDATGNYSFAAGRRAIANHQGAFVWADSSDADFTSTVANQFAVRASGGVLFDIDSGSGLRLLPDDNGPNIIGGSSGNWITSGVGGATISGGGDISNANRVTDHFGTVAGGFGNMAGDDAGTLIDGWSATVSGGGYNIASGSHSTVVGGYLNIASGSDSTVSGGISNSAIGDFSFAAGRRAKANHQGAFVWADSIGVDFASTAANQFAVRSNGGVLFDIGSGSGLRLLPNATSPNIISGVSTNWIASGVYGGTIGGGGISSYPNRVTDIYGVVVGGRDNQAGDNAGTVLDANYAIVGGGSGNTASGNYTVVAGGADNLASANYSYVGGGYGNTASGSYAVVAGGADNLASATYSYVGGGYDNEASSQGSTVGGGEQNIASGYQSTIAGGGNNTASGSSSTIAGGINNVASGSYSIVAGGAANTAAGNHSFAAGYRAKANHQGNFVWADSSNVDFISGNTNQFLVRSTNGVFFYTNTTYSAGVSLAAGGSAWSSVSDRNLKDNFAEVNGERLLQNLAAIPISTWNYKSQDESIRHIGPMAQDFYAVFNVGEDNLHISTIDADGVALAGVQALYAENQALKARIEKLETGQGGGVKDIAIPTGLLPWALLGAVLFLNFGFILGRKIPNWR